MLLETFVQGHNKPITALSVTTDRKEIYTACSDGNICIHLCMLYEPIAIVLSNFQILLFFL